MVWVFFWLSSQAKNIIKKNYSPPKKLTLNIALYDPSEENCDNDDDCFKDSSNNI